MNANELQKELSELFMSLKSGDIKPPVACEMNNAAGKMIGLAKLQLEYARLGMQGENVGNRIGLLESTLITEIK